MYIYSAILQAKPGKGRKARPALAELRDTIAGVIDQPAYAWAVVAGAPLGSFAISTRVDSLETLVDLQMRLAADTEYQDQAAKIGKLWAGPVETYLNRIVAFSGETGAPQPITSVTRATIGPGHIRAAVEAGNAVLELVTSLGGAPGLLTMSEAGNFNDLSWIFAHESAAAADAAADAILGNPDYLEQVDGMAGLFLPGNAERVLLAQLP